MLKRLLKMCSPREDHCPVLSHGYPGQQYSENSGTLNTFYFSKEAEGKHYRIDTSSQLSIKIIGNQETQIVVSGLCHGLTEDI